MKLVAFFLFILSMGATADVAAQKIDLQVENASMKSVLMELTKKTGYTFLFKENEIAKADPVSISIQQMEISEILPQLFSNQPFTYHIKGKVISIKPKIPVKEISLPQSTIRGRVTDSIGNGLEGVVVELEGTSVRTATDKQGYYALNEVLVGGNIVFRLIGYETVKIVANRPEISVVLRQIINELSEVVVSKGYYTTTRELNTGSVSSVKAEVLERQPVSDPLLALTGRVAGLYVSQKSGIPGASINFNLRGQNSIANGNDPLFVIDGVPYISQYPNSGSVPTGAAGGMSPFANIPISAIEKIDVLKDADATAIYGSRGANGVILITTKKAKSSETKVVFDLGHGVGNVSQRLDLMNTEQYLSMRDRAFENDQLGYKATDCDVNGTWDRNRYTDWQEVMIGGNARLTNANLSISGGADRTNFSLSGVYRHETTVFPGDSKSAQYGGHFNVNHQSRDKRFVVGYSGLLSNLNLDVPLTDFTKYIILAPNAPALYNTDGSLNWENSTWTNPLRPLVQTSNTITSNLNHDLSISYQIFDGLLLSSRFGYNISSREATNLEPLKDSNPAFAVNPGSRRHDHGEYQANSWSIEPMISYTRRLNNNNFEFLIGSTFQDISVDEFRILGRGFSSDALIKNLSAATTITVNNSSSSQYRYAAIYSRVGYQYLDRYILNLTGRRDGSSRFGPGKQFGNFWSIGSAWIFSKESFFPSIDILTFGKLRTSFGLTGNDQLGDYKYLSSYSTNGNSYQGIAGLTPIQHTNPNFGWETVKKFESAVELGLLKDRIHLLINYYRNRTTDQLVGYSLPLYTGFSTVQANLPAVIENSGIEIELRASILNRQRSFWTVDLNFSFPRNSLISYPGLEASGYASRFEIGSPLTGSFLYHYTGKNAQTQLPEFKDFNNDGIIRQAEDRRYNFVGQKASIGMNNSFTIKENLSVDIFLQYVNQIGNQFFGAFPPGSFLNAGNNLPNQSMDKNSIFNYPSQNFGTAWSQYLLFYDSDGAVGDASFFRLKNVSVSWLLPESIGRVLSIESVKIYAQAQNLFTISKYAGLDPESTLTRAFGVVPNLPPLRMTTFGIQLTL